MQFESRSVERSDGSQGRESDCAMVLAFLRISCSATPIRHTNHCSVLERDSLYQCSVYVTVKCLLHVFDRLVRWYRSRRSLRYVNVQRANVAAPVGCYIYCRVYGILTYLTVRWYVVCEAVYVLLPKNVTTFGGRGCTLWVNESANCECGPNANRFAARMSFSMSRSKFGYLKCSNGRACKTR